MQIIGQYPINDGIVNPYIGKPVGAVMPDGDMAFGVIDRIHDGHLVMRPINAPESVVASLKKKMAAHPGVKSAVQRMEKAKVRAYGYGGYPYGWGMETGAGVPDGGGFGRCSFLPHWLLFRSGGNLAERGNIMDAAWCFFFVPILIHIAKCPESVV